MRVEKNNRAVVCRIYSLFTQQCLYGTENEIVAGFGLVSNTEKELGLIMSNFLGQVFHVFRSKKKKVLNLFKNIVASTLRSCIE